MSSDTSVPVTDCWPLPAPYLTSCECNLTFKSVLNNFATVPHVTYSIVLPVKQHRVVVSARQHRMKCRLQGRGRRLKPSEKIRRFKWLTYFPAHRGHLPSVHWTSANNVVQHNKRVVLRTTSSDMSATSVDEKGTQGREVTIRRVS